MAIPFNYSNFRGGLNTLNAPFLLDEEQRGDARDLQNVQGTISGAIVKRNGLTTFASPANTLTSLFPAESLAPTQLIGAGSTFLYSISTAGTVTQIASGLTSNLRWEFVNAPVVSGQGPVFGMNGTDTPKQYNGTTVGNWTNASGGAAVPNGKYCLYANNQVFVTGVAANPSRVYWCSFGDPTNWDPASNLGAGFMDLDPNDGQATSGIGRVGPYILVCKPRKLWILVDPATATVRRLSENVGCVAHRSIVSGAEGTYFLADDRGVFLTNGSKLEPVSDKIQPTIDAIQGNRSLAAGAYFNAHYYLSVPLNSGVNDTTLDFDAKLQSWWQHTFGSNQLRVWHPTAAEPRLYSAKASSAVLDRCFVPGIYQDNGANFQWVWRGPWQSPSFYRRRQFPTEYFRKRLRQVRIEGQGTVDVSIAQDFAPVETLWRSDVLNYAAADAGTFAGSGLYADADGSLFGASAGTATHARLYGSARVANAYSMVFSATSNTQDILYAYTLFITDRRDLMVGT